VLTIFEDAKAITKGARTLVAHAKFPMHPKAKLYPNSCGGGGRGGAGGGGGVAKKA
jgi:hypothetical protein